MHVGVFHVVISTVLVPPIHFHMLDKTWHTFATLMATIWSIIDLRDVLLRCQSALTYIRIRMYHMPSLDWRLSIIIHI